MLEMKGVLEFRILLLSRIVVVLIFCVEKGSCFLFWKMSGLFFLILKKMVCLSLFFVVICGGWLVVNWFIFVMVILIVLIFCNKSMMVGFLVLNWWICCLFWFGLLLLGFLLLELIMCNEFLFWKLIMFLNVGGKIWVLFSSCMLGDLGSKFMEVIIMVWLNMMKVISVGCGRWSWGFLVVIGLMGVVYEFIGWIILSW